MSELAWFERDAFWADMQSKIYGPGQAQAAPAEATAAMALLGGSPPQRVLDLGLLGIVDALLQGPATLKLWKSRTRR